MYTEILAFVTWLNGISGICCTRDGYSASKPLIRNTTSRHTIHIANIGGQGFPNLWFTADGNNAIPRTRSRSRIWIGVRIGVRIRIWLWCSLIS